MASLSLRQPGYASVSGSSDAGYKEADQPMEEARQHSSLNSMHVIITLCMTVKLHMICFYTFDNQTVH